MNQSKCNGGPDLNGRTNKTEETTEFMAPAQANCRETFLYEIKDIGFLIKRM